MKTIHCAVQSRPALEDLARTVFDALCAETPDALDVRWLGDGRTDASPLDVIVVPAIPAQPEEPALEIARCRTAHPDCVVVAVCDALSEKQTLSLLVAGASDFVSTPFGGAELRTRVRRAAGFGSEPTSARMPLHGQPVAGLIGGCTTFSRALSMLPLIAQHDLGVLILGETGTGKELFAQAVHYQSARASRPWVAVNCGAIPADLIESELFGHVRGAFTTALTARAGLVREAEGGTLFLDEIDALPWGAQAKLLRFIQEKEYRQVGSNHVLRANVRVIAASNRELVRLVERGMFRQDLYFRLNVLSLTLPPLRARREDIPGLALHFLADFARVTSHRAPELTPQALRALLVHPWPGNVRELKHVIERAAVLSAGVAIGPLDLDLGSLPDAVEDDSFRGAKERVVRDFERAYIERQLSAANGNVTHAAQAAHKNRRAFFELMRKYDIEPRRFRAGDLSARD